MKGQIEIAVFALVALVAILWVLFFSNWGIFTVPVAVCLAIAAAVILFRQYFFSNSNTR